MTFGCEFYNDDGVLQLGAGRTNFFMAEKGVISTTLNNTTPIRSMVVTPTVDYDAIAVRIEAVIGAPFGTRVIPQGIYPSTQAANTSKTFTANVGLAPTIPPKTAALTWYAFRLYSALSPATSGYGLEIYNDDGTVGFSSLQPKIMKGFKEPYPPSGPYDFELDAAKRYAFLMYGTVNEFSTSGGNWRREIAATISNDKTTGSFTTALVPISYTPPPNGINGGFIVLDVTNY